MNFERSKYNAIDEIDNLEKGFASELRTIRGNVQSCGGGMILILEKSMRKTPIRCSGFSS